MEKCEKEMLGEEDQFVGFSLEMESRENIKWVDYIDHFFQLT